MDSKDGKLRLTPLQSFAIETRDLLRHLHGCVSLNRFAPNFQQLYGRPCKAADYGFNRISEVIDIISNVAQVRGKCAEKMVILVDGDDFVVPLNQGNVFISFSSGQSNMIFETVWPGNLTCPFFMFEILFSLSKEFVLWSFFACRVQVYEALVRLHQCCLIKFHSFLNHRGLSNFTRDSRYLV